jgi:hypothetical protein
VCLYAGAAGAESLVYEAGVPTSPALWVRRPNGFRESGTCWESRFESESVLTNDGEDSRARTSS